MASNKLQKKIEKELVTPEIVKSFEDLKTKFPSEFQNFKEKNPDFFDKILDIKNFINLENFLKKLEKSNSALALLIISKIYADESFIMKDFNKSKIILLNLMRKNSIFASNFATEIFLDIGDTKNAHKYINNENKNYYAGIFYFNGYDSFPQDYQKAFTYFQKEENDERCLYYLGLMYFNGYGVMKNYEKAYEYFKKAKEKGSEETDEYLLKFELFNIGHAKKLFFQKKYKESFHLIQKLTKTNEIIFLVKNIIENDSSIIDELDDELFSHLIDLYHESGIIKKEFELLQKWGEKGNKEALYKIGKMLINGEGCDKNIEKGLELVKDIKDSETLEKITNYYFENKEFEKTFEILQNAKKLNYVWAYSYLGIYYLKGLPPIHKINYTKAKINFQKGNLKISYYYLGYMYINGLGVEKNNILALKFFKNASNHGHNISNLYLAKIYQEGLGVKQYYEYSILYLKQSESFEFVKSLLQSYDYLKGNYQKLTISLEDINNIEESPMEEKLLFGYGIEKDEKRGLSLLEQSKDDYSLFLLGKYYIEKDNQKSFDYFERSYQMGNIKASKYLAMYHLKILPLFENKNLNVAKEYLKMDKEDRDSLYYLGLVYYEQEKYKKAFKYLDKSFKMGDCKPMYYLGMIYSKGLGGIERNTEYSTQLLTEFSNNSPKNQKVFENELSENELKIDIFKEIQFEDIIIESELEIKEKIEFLNQQDDEYSLLKLGEYYFNKKMFIISINYLLNSAKKNNQAYSYLGMFSFMKKNYKEAKERFEKNINSSISLYHLCLIYLNGLDVEKNSYLAIKYFKMLLKMKDEQVDYYLGLCYMKGILVEKNVSKGIQYLEKCVNRLDEAKEFLGIFYLSGNFEEKIVQRGILLLKCLNHDVSNYHLGKYYYEKFNYIKAKEYLSKIINQNEKSIIKMLEGITEF